MCAAIFCDHVRLHLFKNITHYSIAVVIVSSSPVFLLFTGRQHDSMLCRCPVLAIAKPSVRLSVSVTPCCPIKVTQARITKPSMSGPWRTMLPGSVKIFYKFERSHPDLGGWMRGVGTTLDDPERPYRTLLHKRCIFRSLWKFKIR